MRRRLYWAGVLLGALLLAAGVAVGAVGYADTSGPDGAVRGYFAALARADAAGALAYGDLPAGPHTLLTATVLREQQRIAPLRDFALVSTRRQGTRATVQVRYTLRFAGDHIPVGVDVAVHDAHGSWRLDTVAVPTELDVGAAGKRLSIVGAGIPAGPTLLFPGALPVRLDSAYLRLDPSVDNVTFGAAPVTRIDVEPTTQARTAMVTAVRAKLTRCLTGPADVSCPLPSERYVPGSVHGRITGAMRTADVHLDGHDPNGTLAYQAKVTVTGSYRRLDFHNVQLAGTGEVALDVDAVAYAVAPLAVTWASG